LSDLKTGQNVGGWELLRLLGEGGNAEVWLSARGEKEAAVKFLQTRKTETLRWERFRREVAYVSGLGAEPGVLPILEYELPEQPRRGERAWYSMPEATGLADALAGSGLREVVEAVIALALTLNRLGERDGAAHRDLKPGNLYVWEEEPAVGDFGLLWRPELEAVTGSEIAGAFSFTAPELFRADLPEDEIDPRRADVFSLAKTLWALARGQKFALPGSHDPDDVDSAIGRYRPSAAAGALDLVIARATVAITDRRPTMAEFAKELEGWLVLDDPGPDVPDLSAIAEQIRRQQEPRETQRRHQGELVDFARQGVSAARKELEPLFGSMAAAIPRSRTNVRSPTIEGAMRTYDAMGMPEVLYRESVCAELSSGEEPLDFVLRLGVMVELLDTGVVRIGAAFELGYEQVMQHETDQSGVAEVAAGSVAQSAAVRAATDWIKSNVERWLADFAAGG
jgi:hypothetical protein